MSVMVQGVCELDIRHKHKLVTAVYVCGSMSSAGVGCYGSVTLSWARNLIATDAVPIKVYILIVLPFIHPR